MCDQKNAIDFYLDKEFYSNLYKGRENDSEDNIALMRHEHSIQFHFLKILNILYDILFKFIDKKNDDLIEMGFNEYLLELASKEDEFPIYKFIYYTMLDKQSDAIRMINDNEVDINFDFKNSYLFCRPLEELNVNSITLEILAASLGRLEVLKHLLDKCKKTHKYLSLSGLKAYPIILSINECLLMNNIFHFYRLGKKKLNKKHLTRLIDIIILVSRKYPSIISNEHLNDFTSIRTEYYWTEFKEIVRDIEPLNRLTSLSPKIRELLLD
jgi:hypothetical protein